MRKAQPCQSRPWSELEPFKQENKRQASKLMSTLEGSHPKVPPPRVTCTIPGIQSGLREGVKWDSPAARDSRQ